MENQEGFERLVPYRTEKELKEATKWYNTVDCKKIIDRETIEMILYNALNKYAPWEDFCMDERDVKGFFYINALAYALLTFKYLSSPYMTLENIMCDSKQGEAVEGNIGLKSKIKEFQEKCRGICNNNERWKEKIREKVGAENRSEDQKIKIEHYVNLIKLPCTYIFFSQDKIKDFLAPVVREIVWNITEKKRTESIDYKMMRVLQLYTEYIDGRPPVEEWDEWMDVLISDIVKAMPKVSCATLETVMNLAALNSVYQGHEHIQKEDITEALLQVVYKLQKTDKETDSTERQLIAVHEAAHAVVGEVLHPGSIGIVTVRGSQGVIGGMVNGCATYAQNEEEFLDEVTKTLAGRAGVSLIYGVMDIQASADIEQADKLMDIWLCHFAGGGFVGIESGDNRMSEQRLSYNEAIKSAKLEELYRRAYKILHNNKYFLLAVQHGLLEHETLLNSDLAKIRESCI